jgi:2-C-methyl-D-erythritol 4-phosphate cytidylyltransferase
MSKKKSYETFISFPEFGKIVIMMHKSDDPKMSKEKGCSYNQKVFR